MSQIASQTSAAGGVLTVAGAENGVTLIPESPPLRRLNYFDGKFLRAEDLRLEQDYLRHLVELSNQAGGSGVVRGFSLRRDGGRVRLTAGLAVDPQGRVLHLPDDVLVDLAQLIERSRSLAGGSGSTAPAGEPGFADCTVAAASAPETVAPADGDLYLLSVSHAEVLCGEEDVYGRLCEEACVTSRGRPWKVEGVVLRATPLGLPDAPCTADFLGTLHRRSRVAAAYFADERKRLGRTMSGARLESDLWCSGAAGETGESVPLAVVGLSDGAVAFIDPWIARRERMAPPPRRYWQWQTMMRPEAVFWAQVLQFQCHLRSVLGSTPSPVEETDPCAGNRNALEEAQRVLETMLSGEEPLADGALETLKALRARLEEALGDTAGPAVDRILIDAGIVELPPAGYLQVVAGQVDARTQARRLLGPGVDVRAYAVRPDHVARALEEAQHLDRICLLTGLEDTAAVQEVDVLVPDGVLAQDAPAAVEAYDVTVTFTPPVGDSDFLRSIATRGAARAFRLAGGGAELHLAIDAGALTLPSGAPATEGVEEADFATAEGNRAADTLRTGGRTTDGVRIEAAAWLVVRLEEDPFGLPAGGRLTWRLEAAVGGRATGTAASHRAAGELLATGAVAQLERSEGPGGSRMLRGRLRDIVPTVAYSVDGVRTPLPVDARDELADPGVEVEAELRVPGAGASTLVLRLHHPEGEAVLRASWEGAGVRGEVTAAQLGRESRAEHREPGNQRVVVGRVVDAETGAPVQGAQVRFDGTVAGVVSGADGQYFLPFPGGEGEAAVVCTAAGYAPARSGPVSRNPNFGAGIDFLMRTPEARAELAEGEGTRSAAVAQPGHPARQAAERGLQRIADARNEPAFRERALQGLFAPAAGAPAGECRVLATRDWVLFRRRAERSVCGEQPPASAPTPAPVQTTCQAVFRMNDRGMVQRVQEGLAGGAGDDILAAYARSLGEVHFDDGAARTEDLEEVRANADLSPDAALQAYLAVPQGTADVAARLAEANAIAAAFKAAPATAKYLIEVPSGTLPGDCEAITVLDLVG